MVSLLGKALLEAVVYCSAALTSGRCAVALVPVPLTRGQREESSGAVDRVEMRAAELGIWFRCWARFCLKRWSTVLLLSSLLSIGLWPMEAVSWTRNGAKNDNVSRTQK
jgi:hypothetical protein